MKTHTYLALFFVAALLTLGMGCSKEETPGPTIENPKPEPPAPVEPKPMIPDGDPAEGFEAIDLSLQEQIERDASNRGVFEAFGTMLQSLCAYYTFCNASSHSITLLFYSRPGGGGAFIVYLLPGQKKTWGFSAVYSLESTAQFYNIQDVTGMHLFYDEYTDTHTRNGIYEIKRDFNQQFDTADPRDVRQWYYEEFSQYHCNWTYIFTDGDYESARVASANRTEDPEWED